MKLHASGEDYLETILVLQKKFGMVRSVDVARHLDVSKPSVCHAVSTLKEGGFLIMDEDSFLHLTDVGREVAEKTYEKHCFFTRLLVDAGVEPKTAEQDACRMEHVVSDETVQQICNFVNYGSTFEHALRNTDLRYRYEPREYSFLMGIYYMEKTCPRDWPVNLRIIKNKSAFM